MSHGCPAASCGCWDEFPQTLWLQTTQMFHLTVLEITNPEWLPWAKTQAPTELRSFWKTQAARLSPLPQAACIPWLVLALRGLCSCRRISACPSSLSLTRAL